MHVDSLLKSVGNPGRYHVFVAIFLLLNLWPVGFSHVIMAFYGAHVKHRCRLPFENDSVLSLTDQHDEHSARDDIFLNVTVGTCGVYVNFSRMSNETAPCPIGWIYEKEPDEVSIVTEWDLVCERSFLNSLSTTLYFLGVMIGGMIFGPISDHYGRRPVILASLIAPALLGIGLAFVKHYVLFVVIRVIQGCFYQGLQMTSFIMLAELFTPQARTVVGSLPAISSDINNMVISLVGYLLRDWHKIQLAYTVPFVVLFIQVWALPESPRWLMAQKRHHDVTQFFTTVAKFNSIDEKTLWSQAQPPSLLNGEAHDDKKDVLDTNKAAKLTFLDLFKTRNLRRRTCILLYIAFAIQAANYGVMLGTSTLPGNKYLVFFIGAVMCSPTTLVSVLVQKKFGRKRPLCVSLILISVSCLFAGFIPETAVGGVNIKWLVTAFALLARSVAQFAFITQMIIVAEMFPTSVRNIGAGVCMTSMRFGIMFSSQALLLGENTFLQLPFLIYGSLTGLASFLVLLLPEVTNSQLFDTIEEVENLEDSVALCSYGKKNVKHLEVEIKEEDL